MGVRVWMDEALIPFLMMGYPIVHEYTSTSLGQRYSHVEAHTYGLRDPHIVAVLKQLRSKVRTDEMKAGIDQRAHFHCIPEILDYVPEIHEPSN